MAVGEGREALTRVLEPDHKRAGTIPLLCRLLQPLSHHPASWMTLKAIDTPEHYVSPQAWPCCGLCGPPAAALRLSALWQKGALYCAWYVITRLVARFDLYQVPRGNE